MIGRRAYDSSLIVFIENINTGFLKKEKETRRGQSMETIGRVHSRKKGKGP